MVAYLIGAPLTEEALDGHFEACAAPDDLGCVVGWNARSSAYIAGDMELPYPPDEHRLCTNPLSWLSDGVYRSAQSNEGAVFLDSDDWHLRPAYADAQCVDGTLRIRAPLEPPRDLMSRILDRVLGAGNWHPVEYQIFFMNLRENAMSRVQAWRTRRPSPQTPLEL